MRILIADDSEDLADVLTRLLGDAFGPLADIDVAYDGARALELALASAHNVAVLDVDMPRMTGIEVADAIRLKLGAKRPVLIAVTGNSACSSGMREAFDHVLPKPGDIPLLLALVLDPAGPREDRPC